MYLLRNLGEPTTNCIETDKLHSSFDIFIYFSLFVCYISFTQVACERKEAVISGTLWRCLVAKVVKGPHAHSAANNNL